RLRRRCALLCLPHTQSHPLHPIPSHHPSLTTHIYSLPLPDALPISRRTLAVPGRSVAPAASNTKVTSSTGTAPPAHSSVTVSAGTIWRSGCATHRWRPELCVVVGRNRDLLFRAGRGDTGHPCCRCALTLREHRQRHTHGPQQ